MSSSLQTSVLSGFSGLPAHRRLVILTFHRVLSESDPLLPDEPTASVFERQAGLICEFLNVVALPDAVRMIACGTLPPRAACITFDDGYRNNYEIALPILEKHGLPATFFIATGAVSDGAMWNDLIIESVRRCGAQLDLRRYGLGEFRVESESDRPNVVTKVLDSMKYLPVDERADQSRRIYRTYAGDEPPSLMMTTNMLRDLADRGFDVGGHTVSHPILEKVSDDRAESEIRNCRDWLRRVTGRTPETFAYPNGRPGKDFSEKHSAMVRDAGFRCAVSTTWGCASPSSDVMALPRMTPWEMTRSGYFKRLIKTYVRSYGPQRRAPLMPNESASLVASEDDAMAYRVRRFDSFATDLPALWQEFVSRNAVTFDQTLPWFLEFERKLVSADDRLEIIAIEDSNGAPVALVPLRVGPISIVGGFKANGASALSNYYTAYFAPLVLAGHESACTEVLAREILLRSKKKSYSVVDLNPVADSGIAVDMASIWFADGFAVQRYFRFGNWYLDVAGRSSKDYLATLSGRVRSTLKRKGSKLRSRPDAKIVIVTDAADVANAMDAYEEVYRSSWKIPEPHADFIRSIAFEFASRGWLRLGIVWVGTRPAAAQLWFVYRGTASIFKLAYDEEFTELSAGSLLTMTLMQHVIDVDHVSVVDYLCGDDEYKKEWMSERRERIGVRAIRRASLPGLVTMVAAAVKRLRRV